MRTALDSSVILDVLTADPAWGESSERALKEMYAAGVLIIGECVLAEITPVFGEGDLDRFFSDWKIHFLPSTRQSAECAGGMYMTYLQRSRTFKRVLPDFLIGAHALHHTGRLLARDRGYYRDYFSELEVIEPKAI
jgi:predicted nucleic acid-binding protein